MKNPSGYKLFYCNVIEQNKGWGAEFFVSQSLIEQGHQVYNIDYRANRGSLAKHFLRLPEFDAFLLQRGDHFPAELVKAINRPKIFWFSELFSRCRDADHLLRANVFDFYYVRTPECKRQLIDAKWIPEEKIGIMLSGFSPAHHYPLQIEKDIDVLFIGSMLPRRQKWIEAISNHVPVRVEQAFGESFTHLVNRTKIVLNIHAEDKLDTETRVYEVLACRTLLISEHLSSENPFRAGEHYVEVSTAEEMAEKVSHLLKQTEQRNKIAEQGYLEAVNYHSYQKRAEQIVARATSLLSSTSGNANTTALNRGGVFKYRLREITNRIKSVGIKSVILSRLKLIFR